ncbi:SMC-Scp complex subunit ScpB [Candidatus Woesearchaeota archaeon]|nr:SMC-Scp complex subunit ScpB [Candidatus Woesearchaeota archaeon]
MEDLKKAEAILFTTGRLLTIEEISSLSGIGSLGYLQELLAKLQEKYQQQESSLELVQEGNKWKLALRKEYLYLTEKLLSDAELDKPTQETLAIIAYKQPMLQSDVIKIRGNTAYDHIKVLKEQEFITSEKSGRTRILKLTPKFFDYFNVIEGNLKNILHVKEKNEKSPETSSQE